jgi:hypothetical protein
MDRHSTLDHNSSSLSADVGPPENGSNVSVTTTQETLSPRGSHPTLRFPGEDAGRTLAQIAQRDLDAALQLLAERAQYITGATGAAIALRRGEHNDMLCRASVGSNAPALGALLSAETGLSGESVRLRQPLRCDDAERDSRVNREGCRELGIASVAVIPIVSDDQVLGVFELFSGKVNAFDERDLSVLQRLGEMVETAVKLVHATREIPSELPPPEAPVPEVAAAGVKTEPPAETTAPKPELEAVASLASEPPQEISTAQIPPSQIPEVQDPAAHASVPSKPLFWTAVASAPSATGKPETDQSHVPPVLRNLHKCHACGFPVSEGRLLCVECEEKRWRGQLRVPSPQSSNATPAEAPKIARPGITETGGQATSTVVVVPPSVSARAAASVPAESPVAPVAAASPTPESMTKPGPMSAVQSVHSAALTSESDRISAPPLFLSAGIGQSESWLAKNKYVLAAVVIVATVVAVIALVH